MVLGGSRIPLGKGKETRELENQQQQFSAQSEVSGLDSGVIGGQWGCHSPVPFRRYLSYLHDTSVFCYHSVAV